MYVIDNSNFCYKFRSVHSYSKVQVEGVLLDTSVLTGYIKSLRANIFNNIVIVLDGVPLRSKAILPNYKGTRLNSENINLGIPKLEVIKFLTAVGPLLGKTINVVIAPGQEADQVISSIAHLAQYDKIPEDYQFLNSISYLPLDADKVLKYLNVPELDMEPYYPIKENIIIATTDSDMAQLQRFSNVYIDTSTSGKAVTDTRTAKAVQSLNPYAIPIYKSIFGDTSDNVPALKSKLGESEVVAILAEIDSNEKATLFYNSVVKRVTNVFESDNLNALLSSIIMSRAEFLRNWDVVFLSFYSVPLRISFNDYDINKTISKFNLKI